MTHTPTECQIGTHHSTPTTAQTPTTTTHSIALGVENLLDAPDERLRVTLPSLATMIHANDGTLSELISRNQLRSMYAQAGWELLPESVRTRMEDVFRRLPECGPGLVAVAVLAHMQNTHVEGGAA